MWQHSAALALGEIGDARATEPLCRLLRHRMWGVRQATATALGQIKDSRALQPLREACSDNHPEVRRAAQQALAMVSATSPATMPGQ